MSVTATVYGRLNVHLALGEAVLDDAHLKVLLVGSGYVFDGDAHQWLSDVTNEVAGTGYVAGGVGCTGVTVTYDAPTDTTKVDCDDPVFVNVTLADVAGAVFYCDSGLPGTSPLVVFWEISPAEAPAGADYALTVPAGGLLAGTVS